MRFSQALKQAILTAVWFAFLTFPLLVIKVDPYERTIVWRWHSLCAVALTAFVLSLLVHTVTLLKATRKPQASVSNHNWLRFSDQTARRMTVLFLFAISLFPHCVSSYQVSIMNTALLYVLLGLGLNVVVGLAGLLDLGYVAFYAVGAYSYALLNLHFNLGFWLALPLGGLFAALFGVLLGFPVLRLRGDYLAIVTLGFGEIIRLVIENWTEFSHGPSGISGIARPALFGFDLSLQQSVIYLYYILLGVVIGTVVAVNRLRHSRIGRAWAALREDEIACRAMGIDKTRIKLAAFAVGAFWAGIAGVLFAAKTTFVSPASFTFMESAIILCIVVLGGMGSIPGVIIAALVLILLPEYLRALAEYRMLAFGASLVLLMIFRPGGLVVPVQRHEQNTGG